MVTPSKLNGTSYQTGYEPGDHNILFRKQPTRINNPATTTLPHRRILPGMKDRSPSISYYKLKRYLSCFLTSYNAYANYVHTVSVSLKGAFVYSRGGVCPVLAAPCRLVVALRASIVDHIPTHKITATKCDKLRFPGSSNT
jgi:hypothetical protein